jgi:hypothetical protein
MSWTGTVTKEHLHWIKSAWRFDELLSDYCLEEIPYEVISAACAVLHRFHDEDILNDLKTVVHCVVQARRTNKPMKLLEKVDNSESKSWRWMAALKAHRVAMRIASLSKREKEVTGALLKDDQYYIAESVIWTAFDAATKTADLDYDD